MTTLLFLPTGDAGWRWMRIEGARVAAEGEGAPVGDGDVIAVAPAEAVTLHWADLPTRSPAQALAAARLLVADASAAPIGELHVAVGDEGAGDRPIAVVSVATMHDWVALLDKAGVDPVALVPAPMLLPRPDTGYVRAEIAGHGIIRGTSSGFADEPGVTDLVTQGAAPEVLTRDTMGTALAAAIAAPPLDLRQGRFARRRQFALDWRLVRRLAWLSLAILSVTLAIDLARIARYSVGADAMEARADAIARQNLARGESVNDADRQLSERLVRARGPGQGFSTMAAAVYTAARSQSGVELTALNFEANGDLRIGIATDREAPLADLKHAIEAAGFMVRAGVFQSAAGHLTGEMTVSAK